MSITRPSAQEIQRIGERVFMDIEAAEAREFAELIDGNLRIYEALDALPDDLPPVKYPRTPGHRPSPADNPYNAWYWQTHISGAAQGPLSGRRGLDPGQHALHIHETGQCLPCSAAKGHFDPGPDSNSSPDGNHPFHAGDLINLTVNDSGRGNLLTVTSRVTLSEGPLSVFDEDGSAIIVHVEPDTYCPDGEEAGCAGGARAACGVIRSH